MESAEDCREIWSEPMLCIKDPTKHQVAAATNGSAHRVRASQYWIDNVLVPWKRQILPDEKAGLIVDNAPAHLDLKFPDDIVLMLLPPNVTCVHQPMDQGIISAFKRIYKTAILDTVDSLLPNWKQIREDGAKKPDGYRGLKDGYAVNMLDALELISTSWKQVSKETVVNCFIKANCLPPIHMNEIMKLTEKGLAKLAVSLTTTPTTNNVAPLMRANRAATAAETAGEALEAVDTVDADLAATDQPTEDELGALIKKMDKIALTVTSSNDFVHANNHRHALLNEVVVAPAGIDKLKAVLEMLTIEDDPEIESMIVKQAEADALMALQPTLAMDTSADNDDDSDTDDVVHHADAEKVFSEDALQTFEQLSEGFLATVRRYAPAEGAKYTGPFLNLLRATRKGMEDKKKFKQTSITDFQR